MPEVITAPEKQHLEPPRIERVRHALKRRVLRLDSKTSVTPAMLRIDFSGDDLADFPSLAFDDHVKLFVPGTQERRDYTPRRFDTGARTLTIDFAIHDAGPATAWALAAQPGDTIEIGGPRGSAVVPSAVDDWLLIGDETALPAMGRYIEGAAASTRITSIAAVAGPADRQPFDQRADVTALWAYRPASQAADASPLLTLARTIELRAGLFVWIAAEATVARALRDDIVTRRGHPIGWTKAAGYWVQGRADVHESIE